MPHGVLSISIRKIHAVFWGEGCIDKLSFKNKGLQGYLRGSYSQFIAFPMSLMGKLKGDLRGNHAGITLLWTPSTKNNQFVIVNYHDYNLVIL